jgi:glycosyltransferase involved in cell wall biosynthesis
MMSEEQIMSRRKNLSDAVKISSRLEETPSSVRWTSTAEASPARSRLQPDRPLRVALFSGNYDCVRDGANQALNRLVAHLLQRHQAEVRIYSPRGRVPAFASAGDIMAVPSLALPGRPEYRLALGLTRNVRADLDAFSADLVHLSAPDLLGRQAQKYARAKGIPVVASLHTRFETYAAYYRLGFLRLTIERHLDRFYGDCDHILAPTVPIANSLSERHGAERLSIWGRGLDPELFHPSLRCEMWRRDHGYAPDDVVPLFFGRLVMEKGLAVFAEAVAILRAKGHAVRPLVVGDGPAREWLARHVPNANFTGHLEGLALGRAVASADILINPSVTEAFGNVNLEAMGSGLAIVAAAVDSTAALISHGFSGLLVPAKDAAAFAAATEWLMKDAASRRRMGELACQETARYRWDEILDTVFDCYQSLSRSRKSSAI